MSQYYDQGDYILAMTFSGTGVFCGHETEKSILTFVFGCQILHALPIRYKQVLQSQNWKTSKILQKNRNIFVALLYRAVNLIFCEF